MLFRGLDVLLEFQFKLKQILQGNSDISLIVINLCAVLILDEPAQKLHLSQSRNFSKIIRLRILNCSQFSQFKFAMGITLERDLSELEIIFISLVTEQFWKKNLHRMEEVVPGLQSIMKLLAIYYYIGVFYTFFPLFSPKIVFIRRFHLQHRV